MTCNRIQQAEVLEAQAAELRRWAGRPLPDVWRVGQKIRYLRWSDHAWSEGDTAYVKELRADHAGKPADQYQVFYTGPLDRSDSFWTTPDDVELVEDVKEGGLDDLIHGKELKK